jgi:hypothetical protein
MCSPRAGLVSHSRPLCSPVGGAPLRWLHFPLPPLGKRQPSQGQHQDLLQLSKKLVDEKVTSRVHSCSMMWGRRQSLRQTAQPAPSPPPLQLLSAPSTPSTDCQLCCFWPAMNICCRPPPPPHPPKNRVYPISKKLYPKLCDLREQQRDWRMHVVCTAYVYCMVYTPFVPVVNTLPASYIATGPPKHTDPPTSIQTPTKPPSPAQHRHRQTPLPLLLLELSLRLLDHNKTQRLHG